MEVKRLNRLTDLLAQSLAGFLISVAGILVIDGIFALLNLGEFGDINGWLALIFPIMLFVGQFSAAKGEPGRILVAAVSAFFALGLGAIAAGLVVDLPAIASGSVAALVTTVVYATFWHVGLALAARTA
jgi:hypothetical protein